MILKTYILCKDKCSLLIKARDVLISAVYFPLLEVRGTGNGESYASHYTLIAGLVSSCSIVSIG